MAPRGWRQRATVERAHEPGLEIAAMSGPHPGGHFRPSAVTRTANWLIPYRPFVEACSGSQTVRA